MDTTSPRPQAGDDWTDKLPDGYVSPSVEQARAIVARGRAARLEGRVIPHERMVPWFDALAEAVKHGQPLPPRPETEAELAAERDQNP